jgi:hypothetical protein
VTALVLAVVGVAALLTSAFVLRSLGPGYRVGRLLAATPSATIDEAIGLARTGSRDAVSYVRVSGRITSDEEFPDDQDRPLVFRRTRVQVAGAGDDWQTLVDEREAVPFGVEARSAFIAVDESALDAGLVVIPREADGVVADLPADYAAALPSDVAPTTRARLVVDQLSAVEHATVCGVPTLRGEGAVMQAGAGRPLIVTTLEPAAAMRVLAGRHRGRVLLSALLLLAGLALIAAAVVSLLLGI